MRVDYTVAMLIGSRPVSITSPNRDVICRIAERWYLANPDRGVTIFVNVYAV